MPVFDIDVAQTFPKRTLQESSPFGGVLSDAIAKRLAEAKAQSAEAEAPYAGIAKAMEAYARGAYASAVMPQQANKAANNEKIWAILTPEQQTALGRAAAPMVSDQTNPVTPLMNKVVDIYHQQNKPQPT